MSPLGPHNIHELLSAFADGELDPAQNLAALDYLEAHPEAFSFLRDRQRLQASAQRVSTERQRAQPMPDALKQRLNEIALAETAAGESPALAPREESSRDQFSLEKRLRRPRRSWLPAFSAVAAAAAVALLAVIYWNSLRPKTPNPVTQGEVTPEEARLREAGVSAQFVTAVARVHVDCSRVAERLHAGGYPVQLGALSNLVKADLNSSVAEPDLSAIGYHFVGVGPCAHPLEDTVHLLYKKDGPEPRSAVSIFVQKYHGQFDLHPGRLYRLSGSPAAFPMYAWRSKDIVYFLVADDPSTAGAALKNIPNAPRQNGPAGPGL